MLTPRSIRFAVVFLITWAMMSVRVFLPRIYAASSPALGSAESYSVIAGSAVTNTGTTSISGSIGISPGTTPPDYTGFGSVTLGGTIHDADVEAASAQTDRGTAYAALAAQGCDTDYGAVTKNLAGLNLTPGVYCADAFLLTGTLTLNGGPTDVWIFKAASSLTTTGSSANVVFSGGGNACNVWWYVPSTASLDAGSSLVGTIIADTSITFATGASLNGRAFAHTAEVTMDSNTISGPTCDAAPSETSNSESDTSSSDVQGDATCTAPDITIVPKIIEIKRVSSTSMSLQWGPYEGLNSFIVEYGPKNGSWLYNTNVTGFDATINDLPPNQPMWFHVAARNECVIGAYSDSVEGGTAPMLPDTGMGPPNNAFPWTIPVSLGLLTASICFAAMQIKRLFGLKRR